MNSRLWLLFIMTLLGLAACSPKPPRPYPPNIERFKETLFTDQRISELVQDNTEPASSDPNNPWPVMASAAKAIEAGRNDEAKIALRKILAMKGLEVRIHLWTWRALRDLGEQPTSGEADQPQGIVVEIPVDDGIDTLAAFADGSARYINFTGKVIILDAYGKPVNEKAKQLVQSAELLVPGAPFATARKPLPAGKERLTILTFAGNRIVETKSGQMNAPTKQAALSLMLDMIQMATEAQPEKK